MRKRTADGFLQANKIIIAVFLFSTAFFLWQRSTGFSWDFSTYVLNAKYLAGSGSYYEWTRQPLPSILMLLFSFAGWVAAEYLYIIAVSALHLYSSVKLSEKFGMDRNLFYIFSMNAYVLLFGLKMGSELLSLAMLQLFAAYIHSSRAGIFGGLAFLARYNNLIFLPLLLIQKEPKKIIFSALIMLAVVSPWLYFNYASTGSPLTSMRDSYMLNVVFRRLDGYVNSFSIQDLLLSLNLLIPFAAAGLAGSRNREYYIMLAFFLLALLSYSAVPFKEERYLFPITMPAAYFAARSMKPSRNIIAMLLLGSLTLLAVLLPMAWNEPEYFYKSYSTPCAAQSNAWVALNYYGTPSQPYPNQEDFASSISQGYRIVLFRHAKSPPYLTNRTFLSAYPVLEENEGLVVYGDPDRCKPPEKYEMLFMNRIRSRIDEGHVECDLLSCRYLK